jgi:hypothetical protein
VRPECSDPLSGPTVTVAGRQPIAIEDAGDQVVTGDEDEFAYGFDDIVRCGVALTTTTFWQPQLCMDAATPMDQENNLGRCLIEISNDLMNDSSHDALLEPGVCCWCRPHGAQVGSENRYVWRRKRKRLG